MVKSHQFLARMQRFCDITRNVTVLPISGGHKIPPRPLRMPLRKNCWVDGDAVWRGKSPDMTLSNGGENSFLPVTVPQLLGA